MADNLRVNLSRYEAICLRGMLDGKDGFGGDLGGVATVRARLQAAIDRDIKRGEKARRAKGG